MDGRRVSPGRRNAGLARFVLLVLVMLAVGLLVGFSSGVMMVIERKPPRLRHQPVPC